MHKKRILISGVGARLRGVLLRVLEHLDEYEIAGVYEPYAPNVERFEKELGRDIPVVTGFEDLMRKEADWLFIGSPNNRHPEQVLAGVEHGLHIFCEKPLAPRYEDLLELHRALKGYSGHFFFGLVLRYSPFYQELKNQLASGRIGKILSFEFNEVLAPGHGGYIMGNWRRNSSIAGTHLLEKCCHDIDIANWVMDSLPRRVASFGGRQFFVPENAGIGSAESAVGEPMDIYTTWEDPHRVDPFTSEKDIVDHQVAILEYQNGVKATFHTNLNAAIPERRFYIVGSHGTLRGDVIEGVMEVRGTRDSESEMIDLKKGRGGHGGGDPYMASMLADTMCGRRSESSAGIREAVQASVPCYGIDQAMETGTVVDLESLWSPFLTD